MRQFGHPLVFLGRHWLPVTVGIVCLLVTNALAQAIPWVVKHTIETIPTATESYQHHRVGLFALTIAGLAITQALIRILSRINVFNAARRTEYELRGALFQHLSQLDDAFYRRFRTGDLMSRLTNDLAAIRTLFGPGILHASNTAFAYAFALPLMVSIDRSLTLYALLPYPLLLLGARSFARGVYRRSRAQQGALAAITATVQEDLAGIRDVKSYGLEQQRHELFGAASRNYLHHAMRHAAWRTGMLPFVGIGTGTSLVLILWIGGQRVIAGNLTLGDLVALNMYVGLLAWPTMAMGWMISLWQAGISAWHRLREVFDTTPELHDPGAAPPRPAHQRNAAAFEHAIDLELRDLTMRIGAASPLCGVTFGIPSGSICAVVGPVGSGKTTLAEALARLRPVPPGTLFMAGTDVTTLTLAAVRQLIAYAPQDGFLFSRSLSDNIAFGLPPGIVLAEAERRRRIEHAAHVAGLDSDLTALPRGLDTVVGERGVSLSGGQRQRVALARALVAERPLLILDDSLSAVDAETERDILTRLRRTLTDTTTVLTSHRLSALQHADQVIVLERGRIAERGGHAELLQRGGLYTQLYHRQLLGANTR